MKGENNIPIPRIYSSDQMDYLFKCFETMRKIALENTIGFDWAASKSHVDKKFEDRMDENE